MSSNNAQGIYGPDHLEAHNPSRRTQNQDDDLSELRAAALEDVERVGTQTLIVRHCCGSCALVREQLSSRHDHRRFFQWKFYPLGTRSTFHMQIITRADDNTLLLRLFLPTLPDHTPWPQVRLWLQADVSVPYVEPMQSCRPSHTVELRQALPSMRKECAYGGGTQVPNQNGALVRRPASFGSSLLQRLQRPIGCRPHMLASHSPCQPYAKSL